MGTEPYASRTKVRQMYNYTIGDPIIYLIVELIPLKYKIIYRCEHQREYVFLSMYTDIGCKGVCLSPESAVIASGCP